MSKPAVSRAEPGLTKALPTHAFKEYLEEAKGRAERLEKTTSQFDEVPRDKRSKAREGLVAERQELIRKDANPAIKHPALLIAPKVGYYEIAGYGSARTLAELTGLGKIARTLQQSLEEEDNADRLLTEFARSISLEAGVFAHE